MQQSQNHIVYIGQSISVFSRLSAHLVDAVKRKAFTRVGILSVPEELLFDVERVMIDTYQPYLNKGKKPRTTLRSNTSNNEAATVTGQSNPAAPKGWPRTMRQRYAKKK